MSQTLLRYERASAAPSPEYGFPKRPLIPMLPSESSHADRREFLRGAVRFAALGGIAAMVAAAARRGGITRATCTRARYCEACTQFAGCDKDQAIATRQAKHSTPGAS